MTMDPRMYSGLAPALFDRLIQGNPPSVGEGGVCFSGAVRLSWPSLSKPKAALTPGAAAKYQLTGLFPHTNLKALSDVLRAAIKLHYPSVADPAIFMNPFDKTHPLKDQGLKVSVADGGRDPVKKTVAGYVPGLPFFTAKSTQPVPCFQNKGGRPVAVFGGEIDQVLYAGCWATVKLSIIKSTAAGNPGVFFGLQSVMKLADDKPFGGGGGGGGTPEDFASAVAIEDPNENQIVQSAVTPGASWD